MSRKSLRCNSGSKTAMMKYFPSNTSISSRASSYADEDEILCNVDMIIPNQREPGYEGFTFFKKITQIFILMNHALVVGYVLSYILPILINIINPSVNFYETPDEFQIMAQKIIELQRNNLILADQINKLNRWRNFQPYCSNNFSTYEDIEGKIKKALLIYDADKTGMADYAMESGGGSIVSTPNTKSYPSNSIYKIFGLYSLEMNLNPRMLLQPEILPGHCYAFYGSEGRIRIKLSNQIIITAVTLEHTHERLVDDMSTAPKTFEVIGLHNEDGEGDVLGQFSYDATGNSLQTFWINKDMNRKRYGFVELHISSNYGNNEYTCIYRFRVHGEK